MKMFNGIYNPYGGYGQNNVMNTVPQTFGLPQQQVVQVKGENGARAYQMGANSSAWLLDESGLISWLVTTDGAGYKSVYPYDVTPHQDAPAPDYSAFDNRLSTLETGVGQLKTEVEALINELTGNITTTTKQSGNTNNTNNAKSSK
jgi:hypothetical protein